MYKCSVKAQLVVDQVRARCQSDTQTNNKWTGRSGNYMYIMGRENADGKATGVVHKIAEDGIRDYSGSRGLGDVYKRQSKYSKIMVFCWLTEIPFTVIIVVIRRNFYV